MTTLVDRIASGLRESGAVAGAAEVLDVLWLLGAEAPRADPVDQRRSAVEPAPPPPRDPIGEARNPHQLPLPVPFEWKQPERENARQIAVRSEAGGSGASWTSGAPALPDVLGIGRAMRPLRIRRNSADETEFDEVATAECAAQLRHWEPVLRPRMVRWPDLALVVDCSPSADIWHGRLRRLALLLGRLGAFREIRTWRLQPQGPGGGRPVITAGLTNQVGPHRSVESLADPSGRRVIMVVTDGSGPYWQQRDRHPQLLRTWARTNPVAILSLVAPRLWPPEGLRTRHGQVRTSGALEPNQRWHREWAPGKGGPALAVPVADLQPRRLKTLADILSGSPQRFHTLLLDGEPTPASPPTTSNVGLLPTDTVHRTRSHTQPRAFELLVCLSAAPLAVGQLLDRVRRMAIPDATDDDLAEALHSHLLEPVSRVADDGRQELLAFRFRDPEVRQEFRLLLKRSLRLRIWWDLFVYTQDRLGWYGDEARRLLDNPDDRGLLARLVGPAELRGPGLFPATAVAALDRAGWGPHGPTPAEHLTVERHSRHLAIVGSAAGQRLAAAARMARDAEAAGWLDSDHVETVMATDLFRDAAEDALSRAADGLLLLERPHDLRDSRDPRARNAVRALVRAMADPDGATTVAVSGERNQVSLLLTSYPKLAELIPAARIVSLPSTAGDDAYRLVRGLMHGDRLLWTPDADHAVWRALCDAAMAAPHQFDADAVGRWAYDGLVNRWRARTGANTAVPLGIEDVLPIRPKDHAL